MSREAIYCPSATLLALRTHHNTAMEVLTILMVYIILVAFLIWVCVISDPNSDSLGTYTLRRKKKEAKRPFSCACLPAVDIMYGRFHDD